MPQKPGGLIIVDPEAPVIESDTFMCCHCNAIITVHIGSGRERGFCRMCMEPTCGRKRCDGCKPFERKLEEMENRARLRRMI